MSHQKFIDNLREKTQEAKKRIEAEKQNADTERLRRITREDTLSQAIQNGDENAITDLLLETILDDVWEAANTGKYSHTWDPVEYRTHQDKIIDLLKKRGLIVRVKCGYNHKGEYNTDNCDGKMEPEKCWPEVMILW